jgi:hypothetical protein
MEEGVKDALKRGVVRAIEGLGPPKPHWKDGCELCALKRTTEWYDETNPHFIIIECDQCDYPMAVVLSHTMTLDAAISLEMDAKLRAVSDRVLGEGKYYIDKKQRSIYDHCHWHARPMTAFHKMVIKMRENKEAAKKEDSGTISDRPRGRL